MSADANDLVIGRSTRDKDVIIASLQLEVDKMVASSTKAKLTLNASK